MVTINFYLNFLSLMKLLSDTSNWNGATSTTKSSPQHSSATFRCDVHVMHYDVRCSKPPKQFIMERTIMINLHLFYSADSLETCGLFYLKEIDSSCLLARNMLESPEFFQKQNAF